VNKLKILLIYPYCLEERISAEDVRVVPIGVYYVGAILKENNYQDYPYVEALVVDAFDQLGQAASSKEKHEKYAAEGKWKDAFLWAEQYWQYQVKTADVGLRAKKLLEEKISE